MGYLSNGPTPPPEFCRVWRHWIRLSYITPRCQIFTKPLQSIIVFMNYYIVYRTCTGASPGFGRGGGQEFFFSDLEICMSRSDMLRMAKPCAMFGGFGGMLPRENFLKQCNLVRFRVYFDQILSLFFFRNYHFLYKKINILDKLLL